VSIDPANGGVSPFMKRKTAGKTPLFFCPNIYYLSHRYTATLGAFGNGFEWDTTFNP
jgi:hypothetical protein